VAYQSLYRKYRPQTFDDIVGQAPVVRTLVNAITEDRLHHAYLFAGPRGTGKTSTARILAKAINCEQGPTATPCGTCGLCVDITNGSAVDVVELDMASHGSVDDARELRERALFVPAQARRKVYILDEVHMASTQAFNALLKLIEEPPAHVLFTMATTDPQKVLTTILSRVQRLDLRRVGAADVAGHVRRIAESEGRQLDAAAVDAVVRAGDGSVRDAMSILEQVLAYGSETVTGEQVGEVLGTTPADITFRAAQTIIDRDVAGALTLVQDLLDGGKDLRRFALDLIGHLRDLLVLQVAPDRPDLLDATEARRVQVAQQAPAISRETLLRCLSLLAEALPEMRQGPPRLPLELALSRAALPELAGDVGALADRVSRLESGAGVERVAPSAVAGPEGPDPMAAPDPVAATGVEPVSATAATGVEPAPATAATGVEPAPATAATGVEPAPATATPGVEPAPAPAATGVEQAPAPATPEVEPAPAPTEPDAPDGSDPAAARADAAADGQPAASGSHHDPFELIRSRWPTVLERVREASRRGEAIFGVATPVSLVDGLLTLAFAPQHANFHAKQAPTGDLAGALLDAVEQVCGHRPGSVLATIVEGGDLPGAPGGGAAGPVPASEPDATAGGQDGGQDEQLAVAGAEAEEATQPAVQDDDEAIERAEELVTRELDAQRIDS